jgi:hypothetical protein
MEEIPSGPLEEEYPVIERDVRIQWKAPAHTDGMNQADSVTTIKDVFVNEDGVTNVAVVDTHTSTPESGTCRIPDCKNSGLQKFGTAKIRDCQNSRLRKPATARVEKTTIMINHDRFM